MQALVDALGPYEPPGPSAERPECSYTPPARTGPLFETFKQERDAALATKKAAMKALRERHVAYELTVAHEITIATGCARSG